MISRLLKFILLIFLTKKMLTNSHILAINFWIQFPTSTISNPIILKKQPLEYGIHIQKADITTYYPFTFSINTTHSTCVVVNVLIDNSMLEVWFGW